jgi:hypothetical protein
MRPLALSGLRGQACVARVSEAHPGGRRHESPAGTKRTRNEANATCATAIPGCGLRPYPGYAIANEVGLRSPGKRSAPGGNHHASRGSAQRTRHVDCGLRLAAHGSRPASPVFLQFPDVACGHIRATDKRLSPPARTRHHGSRRTRRARLSPPSAAAPGWRWCRRSRSCSTARCAGRPRGSRGRAAGPRLRDRRCPRSPSRR